MSYIILYIIFLSFRSYFNISVFSSFCLFVFLHFCLSVFLSYEVIGGRLRLINHERSSSILHVGLDGIGLDRMVKIGHRYSKSTFGANNQNHLHVGTYVF